MEITGERYKTLYTQLQLLEKNKLIESVLDGKNRYYLTRKDALDKLGAWQEMYSSILADLRS